LKELPGYSTNKVPYSKPHDTQVEFISKRKPEFIRNWYGKKRGLRPKRGDYKRDYEKQHFFIPIGLIDDYTDSIVVASKPARTVYFRVKVRHRPTYSNVSHCELVIQDDATGNEIRYESKGWKNAVMSSVRTKVQDIAKSYIP